MFDVDSRQKMTDMDSKRATTKCNYGAGIRQCP